VVYEKGERERKVNEKINKNGEREKRGNNNREIKSKRKKSKRERNVYFLIITFDTRRFLRVFTIYTQKETQTRCCPRGLLSLKHRH